MAIVANLVGKDPLKGIISALIGLVAFLVGLDVLTGAPRLTLGSTALMDGLGLVPMLIGFFAIAEALDTVAGRRSRVETTTGMRAALPRFGELFRLWRPILRGSAIGGVIGAIPGAGATIASIVAWNEERRVSRTPERFGTGEPAGIAAPEAANNACVGAAMIPLLALGIPGSASAAVLLGGLTVQGVAPGPLLMAEQASLVYALYAGFIVAVVFMLAVGRLGIPLWVRVVSLRPQILMPLVVGVSLIGAFVLRGNLADAWFALFFGLIGFLMLRRGFPLAPAVLGLILGPMVETNYRGRSRSRRARTRCLSRAPSRWCCCCSRSPVSRRRRCGTGCGRGAPRAERPSAQRPLARRSRSAHASMSSSKGSQSSNRMPLSTISRWSSASCSRAVPVGTSCSIPETAAR